jgi:hypothetical protein
MGSRAFYEGWDSNRPNIILYINIGVGENSRKFILQSLGRGVRIEPIKDKRRRINVLTNMSEHGGLRSLISSKVVKPLETLFVFGTKKKNLREILSTLNVRKEFEAFELKLDDKNSEELLIIPEKVIIHDDVIKMLKKYFEEIDERIILMENNLEPKMLHQIQKSFEGKYNYKIINKSLPVKLNLTLLKREISRLSNYFRTFNGT